MTNAKWLRELKTVMDRGLAVEIDRSELDEDSLLGFLVDVNERLAVMQVLSEDIRLNGYAVIRTDDIERFREADAELHQFYVRALELRGQRPSLPSDVRFDDIEQLLSSVHAGFDLVTVHTEEVDPDACYIGQVVKIQDGEVALIEISISAEWFDEPEVYKLADITRIDFGGQYEEALWLVAEDRRNRGKN